MPGVSSVRSGSSVPRLPLEVVPTAAPGVRFAVRFPGGREEGGAPGAGRDVPGRPGGDAGGPGPRSPQGRGAGSPHPLAGTGKLFLAVAVARLAERDPELTATPLVIGSAHRSGARAGTLRLMGGDVSLTVADAMSLIVGTGDGACVLALLEALDARGLDVLAEARRVVAELGLAATELTAFESLGGGEGAAESRGEGLLGTTTPADLCTLLEELVRAPAAAVDRHDSTAGGVTGAARTGDGLPPLGRAADRVLGWMSSVFEPAGLAGALPGFGPRTIPHRTVSGLELLAPPGAPGCASVLILPAGVGTGRVTACAAAYHPGVGPDGGALTPREVSATLGALGLAVARAVYDPRG